MPGQPDATGGFQPHRPRGAGWLRHHLLWFSFIADPFGEKVEELNRTEEGILVHTFDLDALERTRSAWGVFRDRRPNLYGPLKTLDGSLES